MAQFRERIPHPTTKNPKITSHDIEKGPEGPFGVKARRDDVAAIPLQEAESLGKYFR